MIAHLSGIVADRSDEHAIVDVGGVGYFVNMPTSDCATLHTGDETRVHVHTYVREDQITLFGFLVPAGRLVFAKLIGINGVGPKLALALLSAYTLEQLRDIAILGNVNALKQVKGVGKKTAERLALELKDLLADLVVPSDGAATRKVVHAAAATPDVWQDAQSALIHLGYSVAQADEALAQARQEGLDAGDLDGILKFSLASLRKR